MAYIKYKEVTKYFNFSKNMNISDLPKYVKDYVFDDEMILAGFKTSRDHGVFTDRKIILFDNYSFMGLRKQIYIIPYKSLSTLSIIFMPARAEISLFLDSGYPLRLKFINLKAIDKLRLRLLYSCISCYVNKQTPDKDDIKRLLSNDLSFEK